MWAYNYVTLYEKNGVHINRTHKYTHSCMYMRSNCIHYIQIYKLMIEMLIKAYNALQVITNLIDNFSHFKSKSSYWTCLTFTCLIFWYLFLIFSAVFFCLFCLFVLFVCFVLMYNLTQQYSNYISLLYIFFKLFFLSHTNRSTTLYIIITVKF